MKTDCKPPYDQCVHGSFYKEALVAGFDEPEAERLTEMVKGLHSVKTWRTLGGDISQIMELVRQTISAIPEVLQGEAVRVLHAAIWWVDNGTDEYEEKGIIEDEFGYNTHSQGFLRVLRDSILNIYDSDLIGQDHRYTFEQWLSGPSKWDLWKGRPKERIYTFNVASKKWDIELWPKDEYDRIIAFKKETVEKYIDFYLEACKKEINQRLEGAIEPVLLLRDELEVIENLTSKEDIFSPFTIFYEGIRIGLISLVGIYHNKPKNEIASWYKRIIIKNEGAIEDYVRTEHVKEGWQYNLLEPALVKALWHYKKYLEELIQQYQPKEGNSSQPSRKRKILFLYATPAGNSRLRTDIEHRDIKGELKKGEFWGHYDLEIESAITLSTLTSALFEQKPCIVHFSGHGSHGGIEVEGQTSGESDIITNKQLFNLFKEVHDEHPIECIVLNSCYSKELAQIVSSLGLYVIGMNQAVEDNTAIEFSRGFYKHLAQGHSFEKAFRLGKNVHIREDSATHHPVLWHNGKELR